MSILIRQEEEKDYRTVENLTREAFWNVYRPGCLEHYVLHCYRTRPGFLPELDLVLEEDGRIIGHIMYAKAEMEGEDGRRLPMLTFGPLSIDPAFQRKGYGKLLVDASLEKAAKLGFSAVAITGNRDFYGKCGFVLGSTLGVRYGFAEPEDTVVPYFLVRELQPGVLQGTHWTYRDPEDYFVAERDPQGFAAFEAQFPPKEKKHLPGQLV